MENLRFLKSLPNLQYCYLYRVYRRSFYVLYRIYRKNRINLRAGIISRIREGCGDSADWAEVLLTVGINTSSSYPCTLHTAQAAAAVRHTMSCQIRNTQTAHTPDHPAAFPPPCPVAYWLYQPVTPPPSLPGTAPDQPGPSCCAPLTTSWSSWACHISTQRS